MKNCKLNKAERKLLRACGKDKEVKSVKKADKWTEIENAQLFVLRLCKAEWNALEKVYRKNLNEREKKQTAELYGALKMQTMETARKSRNELHWELLNDSEKVETAMLSFFFMERDFCKEVDGWQRLKKEMERRIK